MRLKGRGVLSEISEMESMTVRVRALITYRAVAALALSPSSYSHSRRKKGDESLARLSLMGLRG